MDGVIVRRMGPGESDEVLEVLADAFADQPNTLAIVKGDASRARHLAREGLRVVKLSRPVASLWVAERDARIVGVLNVVDWPRCQPGMAENLRLMPAMLPLIGRALPRAMKVMGAWGKRDPKRAHAHFGPVGVAPSAQGGGIGSAIMREVLAGLDRRGMASYLETDRERNVPFYERLGYGVIGEEEVLGVRQWYLWRDVAPSAG
jgi:GNAT superfamily N-acetyltransferase